MKTRQEKEEEQQQEEEEEEEELLQWYGGWPWFETFMMGTIHIQVGVTSTRVTPPADIFVAEGSPLLQQSFPPSSHLKILVNQPHPISSVSGPKSMLNTGIFWPPPQPHCPLLKAFISQTNQAPGYQGWVWLTRSHPPFFVVRLAMSLPTATAVVDVVHHEPQRLDRSIYRSVN